MVTTLAGAGQCTGTDCNVSPKIASYVPSAVSNYIRHSLTCLQVRIQSQLFTKTDGTRHSGSDRSHRETEMSFQLTICEAAEPGQRSVS